MADYEEEHPGLSGFSRVGAGIKHVFKKALKWAATVAVIGGIALAGLALVPAGGAGLANFLTFGLAEKIIGTGGEFMLSALTTGLKYGAIGGAILGTVSGIAGAHDAVDNEVDDRKANYERLESRQMRIAQLRQQSKMQDFQMVQQAHAMGLTPNITFGPGPNERGVGS